MAYNPFSRAVQDHTQADYGSAPVPTAPGPAVGASPAPTSRFTSPAASDGYSPLRDPEGPLARAGWIGALLATGPSKTDHLLSIEQRQKEEVGKSRALAFQKLSGLVQEQGMTPQKAFLTFVNSPEGMDFVIKDPNPQEAVQEFLKMATPDPRLAARQAAFGGVGGGITPPAGAPAAAGGPVPPVAGTPPIGAGAPLAGDQQGPTPLPPVSAAPQVAAPQDTSLVGPGAAQKFLETSQTLAAQGDDEGAKLALEYSKQAAALAQAPTTDELKEYDRAVAQAKAAGTTPPSWVEYKLSVTKAGATNNNISTGPGLEGAQTKARIEVDVDTAKKAAEGAFKAASALPVLEQIEKLQKVPGGYTGVLKPYLAKIATSFGITVPEQWSDSETMQSLTQQLIPLVRQPGAVSDYEQSMYAKSVPSLIQTPEGRAKVVNIMKRQVQRAQEIARVYRDNIGEKDLYDKIAALDKPMFSKEETAEFEKLAAANPQQGPSNVGSADGAASVPAVKTTADYEALKPGQQYTDPNGILKTKKATATAAPAPAPKPAAPAGGPPARKRNYGG